MGYVELTVVRCGGRFMNGTANSLVCVVLVWGGPILYMRCVTDSKSVSA